MKALKKVLGDYGILILISSLCFIVHMIANTNYGFHRDELQFISDSRHLSGGFVAYPPFTAFMGFLSRTLFGESLVSYRFFSALAHSVILFAAGLIARDLGGKRFARTLSAIACASSPVLLFSGSVLMYMVYDYVWWTFTAFFFIKILRGSPRYWIGVGIAVGFGMMTKYSIIFLVIGIAIALLCVPERKLLLNRYFVIGVGVSLLIFLPNLLWLIRHNFITYDFLKHIHARDIAWGRTRGFFADQVSDCAGYAAVPLALAGAWALVTKREMKRFRCAAIWTVAVVLIFALLKGRGYYTAALYIPVIAAGSVFVEGLTVRRGRRADSRLASGRRARNNGNPCRKLWRSRRARVLRKAVCPAENHVRHEFLL